MKPDFKQTGKRLRKGQVMQRIGCRFITWLFVIVSLGVLAYGQTDRATITGTVKDQLGAVLPGAAVTVTNTETAVVFATQTNEDGIYTIPNLPVGVYRLEVRQTGFKTFAQTGISPLASQQIKDDVIMTVGSATETVSVTAAAPAMESQNASESTTLEPEAINDLPLNASGGRNAFSLLMNTAPNVSEASVTLQGTQSWIGMAGGQTFTNSLFVDGTNASAAGNQGYNIPPVQDGIQEMQVQTNVTDSELSQTGGGSIVFALKSGTNKFHGSAFEYLQNQVLNANQWIDNYYNNPRAPYSFNDYGGSVGGPIWKNHTFFFGDIENYRQTNYTLNPTGARSRSHRWSPSTEMAITISARYSRWERKRVTSKRRRAFRGSTPAPAIRTSTGKSSILRPGQRSEA
jgi:hypothetical protein